MTDQAHEWGTPTASTHQPTTPGPVTVAVVNDYEVIVLGVAEMLRPFADRVVVRELDVNGVPSQPVDVALFDATGDDEAQMVARSRAILTAGRARHVVIYAWEDPSHLQPLAERAGASAILSKTLVGAEVVEALEAVMRDEREARAGNGHSRQHLTFAGSGGQRSESVELTVREQQVLALLGRGRSNREIGDELCIGVETVRTYVRRLYQKLGVNNRTQAALRAMQIDLRAHSPEARRAAVAS